MKEEGRARVSVAGIALVAGTWLYAVLLLLPIRLRARLRRRPSRTRADGGLGARFSIDGPGPIVISVPREPAAFDGVAKDYDTCVGPFASPIFSSALDALSSRLPRGARVLDVGCGPGAALLRVARMVPDGEVVGIDVSLGMLRIAADRARATGSRNAVSLGSKVGARASVVRRATRRSSRPSPLPRGSRTATTMPLAGRSSRHA